MRRRFCGATRNGGIGTVWGAALALCLTTILAAIWPTPSAADDLVADLSQRQIEIRSNFTGTEIILFGAVSRDAAPPAVAGARRRVPEVAVIVRGPDVPVTVRRKEPLVGVWVNADSVTFPEVPSYYYVATSAPIEGLAPPDLLARYGVGPAAIRRPGASAAAPAPIDAGAPNPLEAEDAVGPFFDALLRNRARDGLYREAEGEVRFRGDRLFRVRVPVPARVPEGDYRVEVLLFRDGRVVDAQSSRLLVDKTGIERFFSTTAERQPLLYGLMAVFFAIAGGYAIGRLFQQR